ncbi:MAG: maleylpyruvate isomerase N-terminal domain-containing protein [Actinomycetota bacterium]|nr:maleylpyruvate isomerase N-terminal domain-containing protein [Actinomycetota bacterium]
MKDTFTKADLVEASLAALTQVAELVTPLTAAQWESETPCPGWRVADVVAHLADFESFLSGTPRSTHEPDWTTLPHVVSDAGKFIELGVYARRESTKSEQVAELRELIALRRAILNADTGDLASQVRGPFGAPITLERALTMRAFDTWVHEQDIRDAIDQPGGWSGLPFEVALSVLISALPVVWGKNSRPPIGAVLNVVIIDLASEVFIRLDDDGRARFIASAEPTVQLSISVKDLVHRMCGRVAADDPNFVARIEVSGSDDLVHRLINGMVVTP